MADFSSHIESRKRIFPSGSLTNVFFSLLIPFFIIFLSLPSPIPGIPVDFPCPYGCYCDDINQLVDCSNRGLQALSIHLSSDIRVLLCQNNNFQKIDQVNFNVTNLRNLRKLSLANSAIRYVSTGSFTGLIKLIVLDLSNNFLNHIPHDLRLLKYLNQLDLSGNEIRSITCHNFHNKSRLEVLSVPHNLVKLLDADTFSNLKYLQVLSLKNNSISNISNNIFTRTTFLEEVDLSYNQIGLTNDTLTPSLVSVGDWFHTNSSCTANCTVLHKLILSNNNIKGFGRGAFDVLTSLRTLEIQSNEISRLENDVFHKLKSLEVLLANNNQLQTLPLQLFKKTNMLRAVDFSHNSISDIPPGLFSTNLVLEIVHLADNQLKKLDWLAYSSRNIRELYLSNNMIGVILNSTFKFCKNMQIIDMQHNALSEFPRLWDMTKLTSLDLSSNMISEIPGDTRFDKYQNLTFLSIASNHLDTLKEEVFSSLPPVREFAVYENPFNCDCRLLWLIDIYGDILDGESAVPENLIPWVPDTCDSISCDRPRGFRGVNVFTMGDALICSSFADKKGIVSLVLGWLILVLTIVIVYWRWKVRKAERHMRAWRPKKRRKKLGYHRECLTSGKDATCHTVNGRVKTYSPSQHEYISRFDHESYYSVSDPGERDYSPACVCLLQQDESMQSSDLLTETTV